MKSLLPIVAIYFLLVHSVVAETHDLKVQVISFTNDGGTMRLGLYQPQHKDTFPSGVADGEFFRNGVSRIDNGSAFFTFENTPYGVYAVSAIHDENDNGAFDKNFVGVPNEAWAVSNNIRNRLSPPSFEQAQFEFDGGKSLVIILKVGK